MPMSSILRTMAIHIITFAPVTVAPIHYGLNNGMVKNSIMRAIMLSAMGNKLYLVFVIIASSCIVSINKPITVSFQSIYTSNCKNTGKSLLMLGKRLRWSSTTLRFVLTLSEVELTLRASDDRFLLFVLSTLFIFIYTLAHNKNKENKCFFLY